MYMLEDSECIICIGKSGVPSITRYCRTKDHGNKNRVVRDGEKWIDVRFLSEKARSLRSHT